MKWPAKGEVVRCPVAGAVFVRCDTCNCCEDDLGAKCRKATDVEAAAARLRGEL